MAKVDPQGSGLRINNAGVHRVTGVRFQDTVRIDGQDGTFWARELVIDTEDAGKQYLTLYAEFLDDLILGNDTKENTDG